MIVASASLVRDVRRASTSDLSMPRPDVARIVEIVGVEDPHGSQVGQGAANGRDGGGRVGVRDEHTDSTGVTQDPLDLLGRRRLVDRHGDASGGPDREVAHHPLEARARHDRDAVTGARPQAIRPAARSVTCAANCEWVTGTQAPATRRE